MDTIFICSVALQEGEHFPMVIWQCFETECCIRKDTLSHFVVQYHKQIHISQVKVKQFYILKSRLILRDLFM